MGEAAFQIVARFAGFSSLLGLFGLAAFPLYSAEAARLLLLRRVVVGFALAALAGSALSLFGQTVQMAGSFADGAKADMIWLVLSGTPFGIAWTVRMAALLIALAVLGLLPRRATYPLPFLGGIATATLAWGGHGAASLEGSGLVHLGADIVHLWLAGLWAGALIGFLLLAFRRDDGGEEQARALTGFSGLGSFIVAGLVLTGLVNTAFLVPLNALGELLGSAWAILLGLKLLLFVIMIALASANRFVLTPRLARDLDQVLPRAAARDALRRSLIAETALAFAVLALVSGIGTLGPPGKG